MKIKQIVFPSKMQAEIVEAEISDTPGPEEILVENTYGLISPGTELAMFTESHAGFPVPDFQYAKFPFYPGYASVGKVLVTGKDVENFQEGDLVYTAGKHTSHAIASTNRTTIKIPDEVAIEHAPFAVLAQISLTAVRLSNVRLGQTVAVFGQGMIGNFAAQLMKAAGARQVVCIDIEEKRLSFSTMCDLHDHINPTIHDIGQRLEEITGRTGCQIVVEATGDPQVAPAAAKISSQNGKVILLGSPRGGTEMSLYFDIHRTGVSIIGAHGGRQPEVALYDDPEPHELMLDFIAQGRLEIASLHTHTLPASDAQLAYDGLLNEKGKFLGVLLDLSQWD